MEKPPKKKSEKMQQFIHIQGFAELNSEKSVVFYLPFNQDGLKIKPTLPIRQEVFETKVGDSSVHFADVYIPFSEEAITTLKKGTNRLAESIVAPIKDIVVGNVPKPPAGPVGTIDFYTINVKDKIITGIVVYKMQ